MDEQLTGVRDNCDEVFILNDLWLFTARSVKRLEAGTRYNNDLLAKCGLPRAMSTPQCP